MAVFRSPGSQAANVAFVHKSLSAVTEQYEVIRDCIDGEVAVKGARGKYLPPPDIDNPGENTPRYSSYVKRAVFYNVTRRTLGGLVGQVFMRDPEIELPPQLQAVEANASGSGVSLVQQLKKAIGHTIAYSRAGVHVDFPTTEGGDAGGVITIAEMQANRFRPTLNLYGPFEIINWRVVENGAEDQLSLVVLYESYVVSDDGFEEKVAPQVRVLKLVGGIYVQEIYREHTPSPYLGYRVPVGRLFELYSTVVPKGPNGQPLDFIPFFFMGAENNDPSIDTPAFYDLAALNIAHYRNSADYEESCFFVGQPTPFATGLTETWVKDILKGRLAFGSRGGIILPPNSTVGLLQAQPNTMLKEAMESKERQMVALGAKLVEERSVQRTATEAKQERASEGSVLLSATLNVQDAYNKALRVAAFFAAADLNSVVCELNTDFDIMHMTPEDRRQAVEEWQKGAITFEEMRAVLRRAGTATEDDAAAQQVIAKAEAEALAAAAKAAEAGQLGQPGTSGGGF